jgi:hypothetical protein
MSPLPPPGTDTSGSLYQDGVFSRIKAIHFPKRKGKGAFLLGATSDGWIGVSALGNPEWTATKEPLLQTDPHYDNPVYGVAGVTEKTSEGKTVAGIFVYAGFTYANTDKYTSGLGLTGVDISFSGNGANWQPAKYPWYINKEKEIIEIYGITFDVTTHTFYVMLYHFDSTGPFPEDWFQEVVIGSSPDGINWSPSSTQRLQTGLEPDPPLDLEIVVPAMSFDQVVTSAATHTILSNPTPPKWFWRGRQYNLGNGTIGRVSFAGEAHNVNPGVGSVNSIAWADGIWIVGGMGGVATSSDDGKTWQQAKFAFSGYVTGVAGVTAPE